MSRLLRSIPPAIRTTRPVSCGGRRVVLAYVNKRQTQNHERSLTLCISPTKALLAGGRLAKLSRMRLGLFTDLHFGDGIREGTRFCHLGLQKLDVALQAFAAARVDAIVGLGDLVDSAPTPEEEGRYLRTVCMQMAAAGRPVYLVPGNHCVWSLTKQEYCAITGVERTWRSAVLGGWQLLFLDGCFRSDGVDYGRRNNDWKDAMVSEEQVSWLRETLSVGDLPALVFIHQRLDVEPPYGVNNAAEIREILQQSGRVRGVFQGHEHGGACTDIAGIRYTTVAGMVEGADVARSPFIVIEADAGGAWREVTAPGQSARSGSGGASAGR